MPSAQWAVSYPDAAGAASAGLVTQCDMRLAAQ